MELAGKGHADVVGARLTVEAGGKTQTRFVTGGGSYLSADDPRHVIGLRSLEAVDRVMVFWPDGTKQSWEGLGLDRYHRLTQGKAASEELLPKKP
jgi:hypothetical protein